MLCVVLIFPISISWNDSEIVSAIKSIVPCNKDLCGRTAWIDGKEQKVYDKGGIEGWVAIQHFTIEEEEEEAP
jgi:hypothetical protein